MVKVSCNAVTSGVISKKAPLPFYLAVMTIMIISAHLAPPRPSNIFSDIGDHTLAKEQKKHWALQVHTCNLVHPRPSMADITANCLSTMIIFYHSLFLVYILATWQTTASLHVWSAKVEIVIAIHSSDSTFNNCHPISVDSPSAYPDLEFTS